MTFEEFKHDIDEALEYKHPDWRDGQFVFNYIDGEYGVARDVQFNKKIDCFYNDNKIDDFVKASYEVWSKYVKEK